MGRGGGGHGSGQSGDAQHSRNGEFDRIHTYGYVCAFELMATRAVIEEETMKTRTSTVKSKMMMPTKPAKNTPGYHQRQLKR